MVGFGGLAFVVVTALGLGTIIMRGPWTHDNIDPTLRESYARTPLDSVGEMDLVAVLKDLPEFSFPASSSFAAVSASGDSDEAAHTASEDAEPQKVTLVESEYQFEPARIELKAGAPVELTLKNEGKQVHGLWIPDFAIMDDVRSGKSKTFTFIPEKPGRYRHTCSYNLCGTDEEHARMKGFITVK
jgi:heme/copper-type cytochrome/quinol oxidase subunit 2